jgi:hypothetical protein
MLYKGQLNEFIRLAEIDASNLIYLKKNYWRFKCDLVFRRTKLMLTEESTCFQQIHFIFNRIPQSRSLKSNQRPFDSF